MDISLLQHFLSAMTTRTPTLPLQLVPVTQHRTSYNLCLTSYPHNLFKPTKSSPYPIHEMKHNLILSIQYLIQCRFPSTNFEGPALFPNDPAKRELAEELLSYTSVFNNGVIGSIKGGTDVGAPFDYLESMLSKLSNRPFFLGEFSLVDIAYAPFIERYQPLLLDLKKYDIDITTGRPKLLNKIHGYAQTKRDPAELIATVKKLILVTTFKIFSSFTFCRACLLCAWKLEITLHQVSSVVIFFFFF
ncbi:hypothetical protein MKW94_015661 [Papaver nudicaule]|uniref:Glutathione S-transferase n=1 Tax=Papaver nudicaule TaxID=74823 RepID=A0AA41VQD9_PAPNU|nr:hypothetical protein [Papaver nudicaule]